MPNSKGWIATTNCICNNNNMYLLINVYKVDINLQNSKYFFLAGSVEDQLVLSSDPKLTRSNYILNIKY